jgi:hypothetical protein
LLAASGRDLVVLEGGTGAWLNAGCPLHCVSMGPGAAGTADRRTAGGRGRSSRRCLIALVACCTGLRGLRVDLRRCFGVVSHGRDACPAPLEPPAYTCMHHIAGNPGGSILRLQV